MNMLRVNLNLPRELYRRCQAAAAAQGRSFASWVRELIKAELHRIACRDRARAKKEE